MGLDVETPAAPALTPSAGTDEYDDVSVDGDDYRRSELATALDDGAWEQAFDEWAAHTDLDREEWVIVEDLDLVREFDFFWDSFAGRVGYHAPGLPENWRERDLHPDLDSWETVSGINAALTELGQTVCDVLAADYLDWDAEAVDAEDLPDF
jgi:hypothetical protein